MIKQIVIGMGVCLCLLTNRAFASEVAPAGEKQPETAAAPTPSAAKSAKKPTQTAAKVDRKAMLRQIQNDAQILRNEFHARMALAKKDQQAIYDNLHGKLGEIAAQYGKTNPADVIKTLEAFHAALEKHGEDIDALDQALTNMETETTAKLDALDADIKSGKRTARPPHDLPPADAAADDNDGSSIDLAPGKLFRLAYRYFMEQEYDVAIGGFQKFLADFPKHQLAGAAQYWVAESFLRLGEYETARQEFGRLLKTYPRDDKAPDAYYGIGVALQKLGKPDEAKTRFQYVLDHFGETIAANKARSRLQELP